MPILCRYRLDSQVQSVLTKVGKLYAILREQGQGLKVCLSACLCVCLPCPGYWSSRIGEPWASWAMKIVAGSLERATERVKSGNVNGRMVGATRVLILGGSINMKSHVNIDGREFTRGSHR